MKTTRKTTDRQLAKEKKSDCKIIAKGIGVGDALCNFSSIVSIGLVIKTSALHDKNRDKILLGIFFF